MYRTAIIGVLLSFLLYLAAGYALEAASVTVAVTLFIAALVPFAFILRGLEIDFGRLHLLPDQAIAEALASALAMSVPCALVVTMYYFHSPLACNVILFVCIVDFTFVFSTFGGRGGSIMVTLSVLALQFGDRGREPFSERFRAEFGIAAGDRLGAMVSLLYACASTFAKHRKDRVTLLLIGLSLGLVPGLGGLGSLGSVVLRAPLMLLSLYFVALWTRRFRRLPPNLEGCKFVKLSYLRAVAQGKSGIRRCQECPPEAFGNPYKAQHLVVVSHRWLDRFTCDVRTEDHPEGFRLRTMLDKLDVFFSTKACGRGGHLVEKFRRFCSGLAGGNDVLLFFDFMSLPQVGRDAAGNTLDRTPEEDALFWRCLPHMGVLFSMFPVLVCEDVPEGVHSYSESGWCFSEVTIAALGDQLRKYSPSVTSELPLPSSSGRYQGEEVEQLTRSFEEALRSKAFAAESDRLVVRGIFEGFLLKARLMNAILSKSMPALHSALALIQVPQQASLLDQPVNDRLDTPLHLAVAVGFAEAAKTLISHGANPQLRNLRGDRCFQIWLLPACSQAAWLCAVSCWGTATPQNEPRRDQGSALDGEDGDLESDETSERN